MRRLLPGALAAACLLGWGAPGLAQQGPGAAPSGFDPSFGQVVSAVLVVDRDRLFRDSAEGRRVAALLEAERKRLEEETRRIEKALREEELALTQARDRLSPEDFRIRADAFDAKVEALRRERDAARQGLVQEIDKARAAFLRKVTPILAEVMREHGAAVVLDRRMAILAAEGIDITDEVIARIDAEIGEAPPGGASAPAVPVGGDGG